MSLRILRRLLTKLSNFLLKHRSGLFELPFADRDPADRVYERVTESRRAERAEQFRLARAKAKVRGVSSVTRFRQER